MKKEVLINIKGIQKVEDHSEVTEFFTVGNMYRKNEKIYITYDETEVTGHKNSTTTLKIDGDKKVTLLRMGTDRSHLVIEKGRRHVGHYSTPHGDLLIGASAQKITSSLTDEGGALYCNYNLDINSQSLSRNELYVDVDLKSQPE